MASFQDNLDKAESYLARFRNDGVSNHIDGQSVPAASGKTFETISPVDQSKLADVAHGGAEDIDRAAKAAKAAFGAWRDMEGGERKKILHKVADAIEARAEEIALVECMDTGQAFRFMSKAALRGAANFRFFADRAPSARDGQSLKAPGQINITTRTPIGPVGLITPWNTPFMLSTWKIAPALAAGCTIVHKPAEFSPLTARLLVEIAEDAGLPKGVWNTVNGFGEDAGKALTEHPHIKAIGFVGESRTGQMILGQGAATLKRVHFELGGKNPVVVFADADLDRAADAALFMIYSLNGERCTSSSRLLIEDSVHDEFVAKLAERAARIKVGHPLDPATVIGPLIHPSHEEKVRSYFDIAQEEGATIATGGEKITDGDLANGCYVRPTLFTNARASMRIAQEEIFGPVLTAIPFADETEALELANGVDYGLAGYVWTHDMTRALRFTEKMDAGMIWVNSQNVRHLPAPFGGMKDSGIGRDGGDYSFEFYMETKNIALATDDRPIPRLDQE
ncbi:NAD-dependent succinate aldehyde dehydrogenase protein [Salinisphaera shabanensis E1L3A]|uniref:NAD-dependent succinate aldehyde dehydrogenase protein n=1 Tax=Salinisphaera shabanensis E1L3A TaxID=1033802 RepID=U2FWD9_9GAMM|nr:5-carboxymethyl-2-hydroxymuconate semialdehyde dehydrogenase [Salinisphaera shabanensis]ERJ18548.1 NAD-dependent succinate aldehyde dehydrogenase protein [Salinisphaera shabanensis E1L3A]